MKTRKCFSFRTTGYLNPPKKRKQNDDGKNTQKEIFTAFHAHTMFNSVKLLARKRNKRNNINVLLNKHEKSESKQQPKRANTTTKKIESNVEQTEIVVRSVPQ